MKPIILEVNKLIYNIFKRHNPVLAAIIVNWGAVVGVKFSAKSTPLKIVSQREQSRKINILYISTSDASLSMEIAFQQEIIIERIAVYLGYKAIHKIKVVVR